MAINVTLAQLSTLNNTSILSQNNSNDAILQAALPDALSRSGQTPNQMLSNLDMNSNNIINLPPPVSVNSPARLIDVVSNPTIVVPTTGVSGHTVPFLDGNNTFSGINTFSGSTTLGTVTAITLPTSNVTNTNLAQSPANTLKGNNTGSTANVADLTTTQTVNMLSASPWNDTTASAGVGSKKWNPLFFGNAGTGIIDRFNRVFVGEATASSGDIGPVVTKDWLETLIPSSVGVAQFVSVDTTGQLGVVGASRTSDFRTVFASATGGAQGVSGFGYNNDIGAGSPIAVGLFGLALHSVGQTTGITENELTVASATAIADITPTSGVVGNTAFALNLSCGFAGFTNNVSAALIFGTSVTAKFRKGIVALAGGLDTSVGQGGQGVYLETADGMSQRWLKSDGTTIGEIYATSGLNGLIFYGGNIQFSNSGNFIANGAGAAVTFGATTPAVIATPASVAKWFKIIDSTGATFYIPGWH